MGALLKFPISPERDYPRGLGHGVFVRVKSGWTGAMIILPRSPARIIVRGQNDNRFVVSHPPFVASRRELALEAGAYCCRLEGLFLDFGALSRVVNFCRSLTGWSFATLQSAKKSRGCFLNAFHSLRGWVLRHVHEHDRGVIRDGGTIAQERGFFVQGVRRA